MNLIRDGKGRGYVVGVNADNRLLASCVVLSHEFYHSDKDESLYSIQFEHQQTQSGGTEIVGYITNTGDNPLAFGRLWFTTQDSTAVTWKLQVAPTGMSGGADVDPLNMNTGSANTLSGTVKHNNNAASAITVTSVGTNWFTLNQLNRGTYDIDFNGGFLLAKNKTLMVLVAGAVNGAKSRIAFELWVEDGHE